MISVKTEREIALMQEAGRISALAIQVAKQAVCSGVTTAYLAGLMHRAIVEQGAKPNFLGLYGFPASACISVNDEVIHGIPDTRVLQEGDIVSVDVGAVKDGYHGDNACTFAVGAIAPALQKLLDVTQKALENGIAAAQPGARIGDISWAVQSTAEAAGFSVVREYVGHGIGRALHEEPDVPNYGEKNRGPRLAAGMTLAIEPMINAGKAAIRTKPNGWTVVTADGAPSAHFERTIAITQSGPVILTGW